MQLPQTFNAFLEEEQINDHPGKDVEQFSSAQVVEMISNLHKTVHDLQKRLDEERETPGISEILGRRYPKATVQPMVTFHPFTWDSVCNVSQVLLVLKALPGAMEKEEGMVKL